MLLLKKSDVLCFILRAVGTGGEGQGYPPPLPEFDKSVNPIPTGQGRGRLCPPRYYSPLGFSTLPTALSLLTYKYLAFVLLE